MYPDMKKYIFIAVISLLSASCSGFFDQVPDDRLTYGDLFESKASTERALATVYAYIPDEFHQRFVADRATGTSGAWTAGCDEAEYFWSFVESHNINNNTVTPQTTMVNSFWEKWYEGISAATRFIHGAPQCTEMESNLLAQWIGEARALRAIYYFYLFRLYGPIPLLPDEVIPLDAPLEKMQLPRNSVDECVDFIVKELQAVLDSDCLPNKSTAADCGRIDNSIVTAFKAEVLMYAASDLFNGSNSYFASLRNGDGKKLFPDYDQETALRKWSDAAAACKEFIDRFVPGSYDLNREYSGASLNPYLSYLNAVRGDDFNNPEMIFYRIKNDCTAMQYDRTPRHTGAPSEEYRASGGLGASLQIVDAYFMANGLPPVLGYEEDGITPVINPESGYTDTGFSNSAYWLDPETRTTLLAPNGVWNAWVGREPRFYADITFSGQRWLNTGEGEFYTDFTYDGNSGMHNGECPPTGFCVRKNAPLDDWHVSNTVCILMRLPQVYLNYAEALNESDPENPDILTYLNLIRERAGIPVYGNGAGEITPPAGQEAMREAIRRERRVELAFENSRYFDVRRWCIAEETENMPLCGMNVNKNGNDFYTRIKREDRTFEKKMYLFPIPQGEIDIDKQLVQNPGWSTVE